MMRDDDLFPLLQNGNGLPPVTDPFTFVSLPHLTRDALNRMDRLTDLHRRMAYHLGLVGLLERFPTLLRITLPCHVTSLITNTKVHWEEPPSAAEKRDLKNSLQKLRGLLGGSSTSNAMLSRLYPPQNGQSFCLDRTCVHEYLENTLGASIAQWWSVAHEHATLVSKADAAHAHRPTSRQRL